MRVSSGLLKGRKLACPPGLAVRPMTERVRLAVFNILADRVEGARVLDLYAGSGSLGIEALSRGAASAVFVERDAECLRGNLKEFGLDAEVREGEVGRVVPALAGPFDLVFADPPYARDAKALPPEVFADLALLPDGPLVVLHHRRGRPAYPDGLVARDLRDYGGATVAFLRRAG